MTKVTPLVSEDLKKGDLVRWKKYKAMLGFVISPEPTYVGSIAIAVTPPDGYHDARTFATPDELEVIDLNALEAERSALLRERDEAVKTLEATSSALSDLLHHGAWYPETGETHQANPDAAMIALNTARTFLAAQGSSTNTNSEP